MRRILCPLKSIFNYLVEIYVKILKTTSMSSENAYLAAKAIATKDMWSDSFHGGICLGKFV